MTKSRKLDGDANMNDKRGEFFGGYLDDEYREKVGFIRESIELRAGVEISKAKLMRAMIDLYFEKEQAVEYKQKRAAKSSPISET